MAIPCLRVDPKSTSIYRLSKSHPRFLVSIIAPLEDLTTLYILPELASQSRWNFKRFHPLISITPTLQNNIRPVSRLLATHLHPHPNFVLGRPPPLISTCAVIERYIEDICRTVGTLNWTPSGYCVDLPCLPLLRRHVANELILFILGTGKSTFHDLYFLWTQQYYLLLKNGQLQFCRNATKHSECWTGRSDFACWHQIS